MNKFWLGFQAVGLKKYSEDQPREADGKFGSGSGDGKTSGGGSSPHDVGYHDPNTNLPMVHMGLKAKSPEDAKAKFLAARPHMNESHIRYAEKSKGTFTSPQFLQEN